MPKRWGSVTLFFAVAAVIGVGFGFYVYPVYPALVWTLLFVCWACYRLRLRAIARFGSYPSAVQPAGVPLPLYDGDEETTAQSA